MPFGSLPGNYSKSDRRPFPEFKDHSMGVFAGLDYSGFKNAIIGGGLAYSYQDLDFIKNKGKATIHQELASLYGSWNGAVVSVEASLIGGVYTLHNTRKTLGFIPSQATVRGGLFSPHLAILKPFSLSLTEITPILSFDWVNNWQGKVTEHGDAGLNLRIKPHFVSLLRSEIGAILSQKSECDYGVFRFQEGFSFVNKSTFNARKVSTFYLGSISTFDLQLFDDKTQNLGSLQLSAAFLPFKSSIPILSLNYQGEWGKGQSSNRLIAEVKQRF